MAATIEENSTHEKVSKRINTKDSKVIAFVNPKSGGRQGQTVYERLQKEIGEENVYDLSADRGPRRGLEENRSVVNLKVIACGGDGTVGWVLSVLDICDMPHLDSLSVGVIPLGTGNDMARFLGSGAGYKGQQLGPIIDRFKQSKSYLLDRWMIKTQPETVEIPQPVFNNYLSFGADAEVALEFHERREANPERYSGQAFNKLAYGCISCGVFCDRRYLFGNIGELFEIEIDGKDWTEEFRRFHPDAILILNIASYAAGTNPWEGRCDGLWCATSRSRDEQFRPQLCSDGYLELIGFKQYELARIRLGRRAQRIAQGREIVLRTKSDIPMQIDGEPFLLKPCQMKISRKNQARMIGTEVSRAAEEFRNQTG